MIILFTENGQFEKSIYQFFTWNFYSDNKRKTLEENRAALHINYFTCKSKTDFRYNLIFIMLSE